jgi:hypothetical protein
MLTGFDIDRGDMRSFYREDIERYLDISFRPANRNTTKREQMFRRLRTARFLKTSATPEGAEVGFPARPHVSPASINSACVTKSTAAAQWRPIPAASCWA